MRASSTETAFITAVRTFEQGGVETFPSKLDQIWKIIYEDAGKFHAAEEMLVRSLLKNMNGTSPDAERLRRYPLAWSALSAAFTRIPAFSLAKSLADRKFISVLQQTLKDISRPELGSFRFESRKRKRSGPLAFEIETQKQLPHCLLTAESVLKSLRALFSRFQQSDDHKSTNPMGAELIKALFFASAVEAMQILVPLLTICALTLQGGGTDIYDDQAEWISICASVWDLHRQADNDSLEVATHLTALGTTLLWRLKTTAVALDQTLKDRWILDLQRFMTRSLILPSRAVFFNRASLETIQFAVEVSGFTRTITCPSLFYLVLTSPMAVGGDQTTKRDNESWVQAVFEVLEKSVRELDGPTAERNKVVQAMLGMAVQHGVPLSLHCLKQVCSYYALEESGTDWDLLLCLGKLNPDVFLIPQDGTDLLKPVLDATLRLNSSQTNFKSATQFIVLLARGFAKARDLSGFIKKWFEYLALSRAKGLDENTGEMWHQEDLVRTVADILQGSMNTRQLLELLEWLGSQNDEAKHIPRLQLLAALSRAISQEEFVDAVGTKLQDLASLPGSQMVGIHTSESSELRCTIAERTVSWSTLERAEKIWEDFSGVVNLRKAPVLSRVTLAAFKFMARAWLVQHPNGKFEKEAAAAVCAFMDKLNDKKLKGDKNPDCQSIHRETYLAWILSEEPRVLGLYVRNSGELPPFFLELLMSKMPDAIQALEANGGLAELLLGYGGEAVNLPLIEKLLSQLAALIKDDLGTPSPPSAATHTAIQFLLDVPAELINREKRELIMVTLIPWACRMKDSSSGCWKSLLSLMVKLMGRPTFYRGMSFDDLGKIAASMPSVPLKSDEPWTEDGLGGTHQLLKLFEELATLTFRQMTTSVEQREKSYMEKAASTVQASTKSSKESGYPQLILLKAIVAVLQHSPATQRLSLDFESLKAKLVAKVLNNFKSILKRWSKEDQRRGKLLALLVTIEAADILPPGSLTEIETYASQLKTISDELVNEGARAGWEMRIFLARHNQDETEQAMEIQLPSLFAAGGKQSVQLTTTTASLPSVDQDTILEFVNSVVRNISDGARLIQLRALMALAEERDNSLGRIIAINQLVRHIKDSRAPEALADAAFDLAALHNVLCRKLSRTGSVDEFILTAETMHLLLDQHAMSMTQWSIELTLCTVSVVCSDITTPSSLSTCPKGYKWLALLVAIVIKRHRKRLDGHFHILLAALESLFQVLICHPYKLDDQTKTAGPAKDTRFFPHWVGHAKLYSRLLTLVCEPSAASVSRSQLKALDSEKDNAKRYAGQYMYVILMRYVQLQLEHIVPHAVREALEPGIYSILDITTPEGLRIMSDAMDVSGRAIMKELHRQYQKFGKWSGI